MKLISLLLLSTLALTACKGSSKQNAEAALQNVAVKYFPPVNGIQCAVAVNTDIERMPIACVYVGQNGQTPNPNPVPQQSVIQ